MIYCKIRAGQHHQGPFRTKVGQIILLNTAVNSKSLNKTCHELDQLCFKIIVLI